MIAKFSKTKCSTKLAFCAVSGIAMLGFNASAQAGGGYYYGGGYGYYDNGYYDAYSYHHRSRRHGHHHSHGGGKGAAIALGIIGGAILINELAEERARDRAYEDRYERRHDRYSRRAQPVYSDPIIFPEDDYDEDAKADPLDDRLAGGDQTRADDGGPAPIRYSYDQAYRTCMTHARAALSDRGFILAAPARPETAEEVGRAWKMTANVSAQNDRGESWNRAMYCEADDSRVYLLELI